MLSSSVALRICFKICVDELKNVFYVFVASATVNVDALSCLGHATCHTARLHSAALLCGCLRCRAVAFQLLCGRAVCF